jgi:iron complex transport system substrate-binding protein
MFARSTITILLVITALVGCRAPATDRAAGPTREVRDELDRTVKIPQNVKRVVSLAPNLTESVFAIGAGDRLVGVTSYCNYPQEAAAIQKVGDTMSPNLETIIALKPDLVLVSTASQIETFSRTLESNGIAIYVTDPKTLDGVLKSLADLGAWFGTEETAAGLVANLGQRFDAVRARVVDRQPKRVFVQISNEPLFTVGKGSFITELIRVAGGVSVTENIETAYPKISKETAMALEPDAILLSASVDNTAANEVFRNSPAVRSRRVYSIDADLISRAGPRMVDAVEQIAQKLHFSQDR